MSRKYLQYSLLMMLLMAYKPSFSMYRAIFKAARAVGVGTLPTIGMYKAYKQGEGSDEFIDKHKLVEDGAVKDWFVEEKKKLNTFDDKSISLVTGRSWASFAHKKKGMVLISPKDHDTLNDALINQPIAEARLSQNLKELDCWKQQKERRGYFESFLSSYADNQLIQSTESQINLEKQNIDQYKAKIAQDAMVLKHEFGHIAHKDSQNAPYTIAAIPLGVEASSFGITSAARKLFNIQTPKTFIKTALRSSFALGAIIPKALVGAMATVFFKRHREAEADKFACENAESRLELETFEKYFPNNNHHLKDGFEVFRSGLALVCKLPIIFYVMPTKLSKKIIEGFFEVHRQLNDPATPEQRKKILRNALEMIRDTDHPLYEKRTENIRKYIDKWDREHPASEKS